MTEKSNKETEKSFEEKAKNLFTDVKEEQTDKKDVESGKGMSILAYIGLLVLIPFLAEKKNKFVVFHAKQGLNLLIIEAAYGILGTVLSSVIKTKYVFWGIEYYATPGWLSTIITLGSLGFIALSIVGIVYACQGKAKELPIVNKIKIIK